MCREFSLNEDRIFSDSEMIFSLLDDSPAVPSSSLDNQEIEVLNNYSFLFLP